MTRIRNSPSGKLISSTEVLQSSYDVTLEQTNIVDSGGSPFFLPKQQSVNNNPIEVRFTDVLSGDILKLGLMGSVGFDFQSLIAGSILSMQIAPTVSFDGGASWSIWGGSIPVIEYAVLANDRSLPIFNFNTPFYIQITSDYDELIVRVIVITVVPADVSNPRLQLYGLTGNYACQLEVDHIDPSFFIKKPAFTPPGLAYPIAAFINPPFL